MRKTIAWAVMSLAVVALLGGCLPRCVPADDAEVSAALKEVLQQYEKRAGLARELIGLIQPVANRNETLGGAVQAAQADPDCIRTAPGALVERVAFQRFEIAQRQLGDVLSRLLVESANDRHFHKDPASGRCPGNSAGLTGRSPSHEKRTTRQSTAITPA
ncbi:hypothetical protein [Paraburkholderia sp. RL17-337-BIB-A]|uniref:hypothetical protein n=1 Tax=Paraburkholderia sp. RL17-337-BIB-A TaxID=3031636 RepID=UPI0038BAC275